MSIVSEQLQRTGEVVIDQLYLVSAEGIPVDLRGFMIELSIYESIYSPVMSGSILISDSKNLFKTLGICGEEYIVIQFRTPNFDSDNSIRKTFKVYSITDRAIIDQSTTQMILNFISYEAIRDTINNLFSSFEGKISEVVGDIFDQHLSMTRNLTVDPATNKVTEEVEKTSLLILDETENSVKFVSPGWSPIKCIQWLASKAIPAKGKACNFLFWESNKQFYFGPIEKIFEISHTNPNMSIGRYKFFPPGPLSIDNLTDRMYRIEDIKMSKIMDTLSGARNGYLSNRMVALDIMNKDYQYNDYYHLDKFDQYNHTSGSNNNNAKPLYSGLFTNPKNNVKVYTVQSNLFTGVTDNVNEKMPEIYGNRLSNLHELKNYKIEIAIPGRTDVEVGSMIEVDIPDTSPVDDEDIANDKVDAVYSGMFLITKIHHKINAISQKHSMLLEIAKDSYTGLDSTDDWT